MNIKGITDHAHITPRTNKLDNTVPASLKPYGAAFHHYHRNLPLIQ